MCAPHVCALVCSHGIYKGYLPFGFAIFLPSRVFTCNDPFVIFSQPCYHGCVLIGGHNGIRCKANLEHSVPLSLLPSLSLSLSLSSFFRLSLSLSLSVLPSLSLPLSLSP